ncbi:MAG TPA: polymorphic toxin-type HINT domain-containing protein [Isosphaeraceae bacterium]|jgi:hypothetical protein|nr:polymorphic toxin-type HINT domain-containing protein [Isosphaeraceae bacterium]
MVGVALICGALLAGAVDATPRGDRETYQAMAQEAGKDADAHVKLALWCEAHGMAAERVKHLGVAVLLDPAHVTARGLLGFLRDGDRWRPFDRAPADDDATTARALAEYETRRAAAPKTAKGQFELAQWCEQKGLKPEAVAHYTSATRINPKYEPAWKALGCRNYRGRWLNDAQYKAAVAEADAQRKADGVWIDRLGRWKREMNRPSTRPKAEAAFAAVADPRAVPAILQVLGDGRAPAQAMAVAILQRIETPAASTALAEFVARSPYWAVSGAAEEALVGRDAREVVEPLIDELHGPTWLETREPGLNGTPGALVLHGERAELRRLYVPPAPAFVAPNMNPFAAVRDSVTRTRSALDRDAGRARQIVAQYRWEDGRVRRALARLTSVDKGDEPDAWRAWWADQRGYAFEPAHRRPRVVRQLVYVPPPPPPRIHHNCFAAGTPVRTAAGPKPIETLQVGDLVLTQDTASGALSQQPVVAAFHNPPNATLRIKLGDDELVATPIHRFWVAGKGWALARDLKPGDPIRTLRGIARVGSVSQDVVQPVFNLEVAAGHSFFVGHLDALVHDHSLLGPPNAPFDAPPEIH